MLETKNARITHASLSSEDHGCLTGWLTLDYGGAGQGFGGFALYQPTPKPEHAEFYKGPRGLQQKNFAGHFIWRVLEVVGVTKWESLVGQTIRVQCEHHKIHAIGNILKDEWFNPQEEFASAMTQDRKEGRDE